jgi:hypothetical protein
MKYELINNELMNLYKSNLIGVSNKIDKLNLSKKNLPASPLLIKATKNYCSSDIKTIIFGQETNRWGHFPCDVETSLKSYEDFFNDGLPDYHTTFFLRINKILHYMRSKYPKYKIEYLWNNIVKIGNAYKKGKPDNQVYDIEKNNFSIISHEMKILKPDVVIFLIGNSYDYVLDSQFSDNKKIKVDDSIFPIKSYGKTIKKACISKIIHKNLPENSYKTYHPSFLARQSKIGYSIMEKLVDIINV